MGEWGNGRMIARERRVVKKIKSNSRIRIEFRYVMSRVYAVASIVVVFVAVAVVCRRVTICLRHFHFPKCEHLFRSMASRGTSMMKVIQHFYLTHFHASLHFRRATHGVSQKRLNDLIYCETEPIRQRHFAVAQIYSIFVWQRRQTNWSRSTKPLRIQLHYIAHVALQLALHR